MKHWARAPTVLKLSNRFNNGWPDAVYLGDGGKLAWVEYKVAPNKLTKLQEDIIRMLREKNHVALVITKKGSKTLVDDGATVVEMEPILWFEQFFLGANPLDIHNP